MSEARKRPQLSLQELYQVNWFLGIVLAMLSIWTTFYLKFPVLPHVLITSGVVAIAAFRPQLTAYLPRLFWQAMPFFLVILLAVDLHFSDEPVPALVRLNILLILYRALAFRRKREDLQLIVLSLFLVIIAGVLTVALTFVVQILLFTGVAMAFLFNITLMEDERQEISPREVWQNFTWRRFVRKLCTLCDASFVVVAAITFGSVVVISVLLFLFIPRFDINNPIPFFGIGRTSQTGFSEEIRFGDVTDIRNNQKVALRVEVASNERVPAEPYWRMLVLDQYVDGGFKVSQAVSYHTRSSQGKTSQVHFDDDLIRDPVRPEAANTWTFYLEGGVARYLPLTGPFQRVRLQEGRTLNYIWPFRALGLQRGNSGMLVYQVENMGFDGSSPDPNFGKYALEYPYYPEIDMFWDHDYINYPDTTLAVPPVGEDRDYLRQIVEELKAGEETLTNEEFAARASQWLQLRRYGTSYSLEPAAGDHVVRWLRSDQPGHCEVFAGALVLLCRTAGIPARVVTGFKGGTWNTFENYFMVRYSDAHAWVEVFDGAGRWARFDPTPGADEPDPGASEAIEAGSMATDSSFAAYVDSLRILWYRRIVSFDKKSQFELWHAIKETYSRFNLRAWLEEVKELISAWVKSPWDTQRWAEVLGLFGAGGIFCFLVAFCVRRDRMGLFFLFSRPGGDPVRRRAGDFLQRLDALAELSRDGLREENAFQDMVLELQRVRYGSPAARARGPDVFRRARRFLREQR